MTVQRHTEMEQLPAFAIAGEVNGMLETHPRLIVTAPPGAGKSTVLPLTLLSKQKGKILMLEPRRVAARQIAERMAWLLGEAVGQTVGYRIRFETKISAKTRIEVLTEGILTRMLIEDPGLEGVSAVIFDEFHERSLSCDEALALTRQSQQLLREDLRILLMSATLDTAELARALDAPVVKSRGKLFPVEVRHAPRDSEDCVADVVRTVREAHAAHEGDILAFLPGEAEIRRSAELLDGSLGATRIFPLYGLLSNQDQRLAIAPSAPGERKVVLATPIAETSLTIEGVRVVVDSGLCRKAVVDARTGLSRLETVRVSLDMATQRSGRAGRVAPGVCYRLWTPATEARMAPVRTPEILEADLSGLFLDLATWGGADDLPWLTPPPVKSKVQAIELLQALDALDENGRITPHGRALSRFPCHPRLAQMLLSGNALAPDLAALLEEKDPLPDTAEAGLDLRVNALRRARATGGGGRWSRLLKTAAQYRTMAKIEEDNRFVNPYEAGALVACAFPERVGRIWPEGLGQFLLASGDKVAVEASDALTASEWIAVAAMNAKPGGVGRIFLAAPVAPEDLRTLARTRDRVFWDAKAGAVVARRERRIGTLILDAKELADIPRAEVDRLLAEAALKDGRSMFDWSDQVAGLQRRISVVASWRPSLELPPVDTDSVLAAAGRWGPVFWGKATSAAELRKVDLCEVIWSLLSYEQRVAVERLAPSHLEVPTGSRIALDYRQGADAPVLRIRLQECFGLLDTPRVDDGRRTVLMELLSPGYKSVQLTTDLRSFWADTYFEVRKELRRRYPKHAWPDNPLEAEPTRRTKR
ncbi:MAG: ATP-dependent helicase HrpB [Bacteroidales bacterium]|nr:ATP-dependent helicase HrpB [Bacteroidales bacterium]